MRRTWFVMGTSLVVGIALGAAAACVLASRASRLYVQMVRLSFASEEESRLAAAWKVQDLRAAVRLAACGIELEGDSDAFDPAMSTWSPTFIAAGIWVNERTRYPVEDRTKLRALAHARMGRVLEAAGRADEAVKEYAAAGQLGGDADVEKWRKAGETTLGGAPPGK